MAGSGLLSHGQYPGSQEEGVGASGEVGKQERGHRQGRTEAGWVGEAGGSRSTAVILEPDHQGLGPSLAGYQIPPLWASYPTSLFLCLLIHKMGIITATYYQAPLTGLNELSVKCLEPAPGTLPVPCGPVPPQPQQSVTCESLPPSPSAPRVRKGRIPALGGQ